MGTENANEWTLDVTSPADAAGWLEDGTPPAGDIRILVGDEDDYSEQPYREVSLLDEMMVDLLIGIPALLDGESVHTELDTGDITLTPMDSGTTVEVAETIDGVPDDIRDYEPDRIEMTAFVQEIYQTIRGWHETAIESYPDLKRADWFQNITRGLTDARAAMEAKNIDLPD
ncbi:hypothetical protein NDI56_06525 [Haloarcula sp. S1CR25-12]|uniref:Uncharacterized protein n=1 Tax=Haloarcula saliterrae TaxID=2950534 RepID=A0ABU2F9X5_9EURY|nr:hypothetical protein [Haloarcula sp. S1CR25-12]MDS0259044.1 hypothetical protein [Haloarcula sp. S1CR25-12]